MSFKVRHFDIIPYSDKFLLRDPLGISKEIILNRESLLLLSLLDGKNSLEDIKVKFLRNTGIILSDAEILGFLQEMDRNYILYNDTFLKRLKIEKEKINSLPFKEINFSFNFEKLRVEIENAGSTSNRDIKGVIVPHIDINVGLETYIGIYSLFKNLNKDIFFILGVPHFYSERYFSVFPKDYKFGRNIIKIERKILKNLKPKFDFDICSDLIAYKNEHSVEFPLIFLTLIKDSFWVIPSLVSECQKNVLIELSRKIFQAVEPFKERILFISSIDLSHVGRKFGDKRSFDTKEIDTQYLEYLRNMECEKSLEFLESKNNFTRVDGIYTNFVFLQTLKLLGAQEGEILDYNVYYEEATDSAVTYAGLVFK